MSEQSVSMSDLQAELSSLREEVTTLNRYIIGLSAVIAAIPETAELDNDKVRAFVGAISGPGPEAPHVTQTVAQAMLIAQQVQELARQGK